MEVEPNAQQLEPQHPQTHVWEQDEEDNEDAVGVGLVPRHSHSKRRTHVVATKTSTKSSSSSSSSLSSSSTSETEAGPATGLFPSANAPDESQRNEVMEINGIRNSVYFDQLQGKWKCRHCKWTHQIGSPCFLNVDSPKGYLNMAMNNQNFKQWGPCFSLETKGTGPINGVSEITKGIGMEINSQLAIEHWHEETDVNSKHSDRATKVDAHVDLIEEIEEDLVDLDVERVLEEQNTHDLYCPNCNSCITRRVILRRKKPKVPYIRRKSKGGKKLGPIPDPAAEIETNVSPTPAPAVQNDSGEHVFNCLSCFSLFIPIGGGCFKIFNIFRPGKKPNESAQTAQAINQSKITEIPQQTNEGKETQGPQKRNQHENIRNPPTVGQTEVTQSPSKISHDEDTGILQQISSNEGKQIHQNINQNESKKSPEKIPGGRTGWIFSFYKGNATVAKVPAVVVTGGKQASKEPRTGNNDILDLEVGLLPPELPPSTGVETHYQGGNENERVVTDAGEAYDWEILKSIVYGGLLESITSLSIVSSAAGAGADTLNILVLGMANLIGGLLVIIHNLRELKNEQPPRNSSEEDQYEIQLGRRQHFVMHMFVAIVSFLVFGLVPPVVYGFSFRKSNDKDFKLAAVAGASLFCIFMLSLAKGHVKRPHRAYFSNVSYYVGLGISTSGISVVVGELFRRLLVQLGLFDSASAVSMPFLGTIPEMGGSLY